MIRLTDERSPEAGPAQSMARGRPPRGWGRTSFAILFICLCFCGICGWVIFDARQAAWKHAGVVGSTDRQPPWPPTLRATSKRSICPINGRDREPDAARA